MELIQNIIILLSMLFALMILDYIWLGIIIQDFIINQFGSLIKTENGSIKINLLVGIFAWIAIAVGCFIFALMPSNTLSKAILLGGLFGLITYAIYDLTNLAFIKNYPIRFAVIDILWGGILCSAITSVGYYVRYLFV